MAWKFDDTSPLFLQIAEQLENEIFIGLYNEGDQIPSTTELSVSLKINPATVLKGMNLLVDEGFIEKRRGLGMFVTAGANNRIKEKRKKEFKQSFIAPLVKEAKALKLSKEELMRIIGENYEN